MLSRVNWFSVVPKVELGISGVTLFPQGSYTNSLIPRSRVLLDTLTVIQLVKKFPAFYGSRRFITEFTTARQWSLSWARCIQYTISHTISLRFITFPSTPGSSEWCLLFRFSDQNFMCISRLSHIRSIPQIRVTNLNIICLRRIFLGDPCRVLRISHLIGMVKNTDVSRKFAVEVKQKQCRIVHMGT
jgi:hypothetical protein